jgi:hypothetical protein
VSTYFNRSVIGVFVKEATAIIFSSFGDLKCVPFLCQDFIASSVKLSCLAATVKLESLFFIARYQFSAISFGSVF